MKWFQKLFFLSSAIADGVLVFRTSIIPKQKKHDEAATSQEVYCSSKNLQKSIKVPKYKKNRRLSYNLMNWTTFSPLLSSAAAQSIIIYRPLSFILHFYSTQTIMWTIRFLYIFFLRQSLADIEPLSIITIPLAQSVKSLLITFFYLFSALSILLQEK